ncbi:Aspartyl/Asparaginyl beta-hydroxylase [compost metagenome]
MRNFLKIGQGTDVMPLLAAIARQPDLWKVDTYLRDYPQGPFGDIDSIILRFPKKIIAATAEEAEQHIASIDQHESLDTPSYALLPEARPLVMGLMSYVGGTRLGRVIINRIRPGGRITPHCDTPDHAAYYERHHIVIQSAPGVVFRCEDEQVYMGTGETWWFNNALEHEVVNNSAMDRIHLIVDVRCAR